MLDDDDMHYMYDSGYGTVELGTVFGLAPFYMMLNQLFRYTLAPKIGNLDRILNMSKNLLARVAAGQVQFNVFDFIWE